MKVGFAKIDLTPPIGLEMSGYGIYLNRMAEGVLDPLYARCIALESGGVRILLIALDLIALDVESGLVVREQLADEFGTTADRVFIAGTHTHSGPCAWTLRGWGDPDPEYMARLPGFFADAARAAVADLAPCTISAGAAAVEPIGHNRVGFRPEDIDTQVRVVRFDRRDGAILILNHACHAVTLGVNKEFSADYPGGVCRALEANSCRGLFFNGCCGDIDPKVNRV